MQYFCWFGLNWHSAPSSANLYFYYMRFERKVKQKYAQFTVRSNFVHDLLMNSGTQQMRLPEYCKIYAERSVNAPMPENLQRELDRLLETLAPGRPTLLLHVCCAPCSSYVLEYLRQYFSITLCYYNPNIDSREEYDRRLEALHQLLAATDAASLPLLAAPYDPAPFLASVQGLEHEPEGGSRCERCFRLRLRHTAETAQQLGSRYFTTTLSISPHKNAALLGQIAAELSAEHGVRHLPSDFKKRGGYQRSIVLSRELGLYRQDYCGCAFSKRAVIKPAES